MRGWSGVFVFDPFLSLGEAQSGISCGCTLTIVRDILISYLTHSTNRDNNIDLEIFNCIALPTLYSLHDRRSQGARYWLKVSARPPQKPQASNSRKFLGQG